MAGSYIWFRGVRATPQGRDAVLAAEERAGFKFRITQGGFNAGGVSASSGTHDLEAFDFSVYGLSESQVAAMIEALRWAGFAAWFRTTSVPKWGTRAQGFGSYHVHAVPNGWGQLSPAARRQVAYQSTSSGVKHGYRYGRDGLRANLADAGPGHTSLWRTQTTPRRPASSGAALPTAPTPGLPTTGVDNTPTTPQEDDMTPEQEAKLDTILENTAAAFGPLGGRQHITEQARATWGDVTVTRNGEKLPIAQELANTGTLVIALRAELAGLAKALESLAAGQGVDMAAVQAAAKAGAQEALSSASVTIDLGGDQ